MSSQVPTIGTPITATWPDLDSCQDSEGPINFAQLAHSEIIALRGQLPAIDHRISVLEDQVSVVVALLRSAACPRTSINSTTAQAAAREADPIDPIETIEQFSD